MSYLETIYNTKRTPKTGYPAELTKYLVKRFRLKKGNKLLELGYGRGDFLIEFKKRGLVCFGIDWEVSISIDKNIKVKRLDLSNGRFPFANASIDVVYHKSVLEHFYKDEADHIMRETKRVLKKGGKLLIMVPDWNSQSQTFFEDYTHVHPYSRLALEDLLKIYGFKNVISEKFYQFPVIWKIPVIKYLSQIYSVFVTTVFARRLTEITGWKFFRWSKELMLLGYGEKK